MMSWEDQDNCLKLQESLVLSGMRNGETENVRKGGEMRRPTRLIVPDEIAN